MSTALTAFDMELHTSGKKDVAARLWLPTQQGRVSFSHVEGFLITGVM